MIPEGGIILVRKWISQDPVQLIISKPRSTKLGDFRPGQSGKPARISINQGLHPVECIITIAHEFAHAEIYRLYGRRVKPHGKEWKLTFREKLHEIVDIGILEKRYSDAIKSCYLDKRGFKQRCDQLSRIFGLEKSGLNSIRLEDIPEGSEFVIGRKRLIKGARRRTRFECREKGTRRIYTVHSMAEIHEFRVP
jgi:hypothetical protein